MDPAAVRNRLLIATGMWRETTENPLPKLPPGEPLQQIQDFELQVMELMFSAATAENAKDVADKTWGIVHDRPDDDPVKQRVVEGHEHLARLSAEGRPATE